MLCFILAVVCSTIAGATAIQQTLFGKSDGTILSISLTAANAGNTEQGSPYGCGTLSTTAVGVRGGGVYGTISNNSLSNSLGGSARVNVMVDCGAVASSTALFVIAGLNSDPGASYFRLLNCFTSTGASLSFHPSSDATYTYRVVGAGTNEGYWSFVTNAYLFTAGSSYRCDFYHG